MDSSTSDETGEESAIGLLTGTTSSTSRVAETEELLQPIHENGRFWNPWRGFKLPTFGMMARFLLFENRKSRVPNKQVGGPINIDELFIWKYLNTNVALIAN